MSWADDRRAERDAAAERRRRDADAGAERRIREQRAAAELARTNAAADDERDRADRQERRAARQAARAARQQARRERATRLVAWLSAHRVGLLIYPLAVASLVMAFPAMGDYGRQLYDGPTGVVLPVLSELGMWAFAFAVEIRRRRDPHAPIAPLVAGVVVFAAIGFTANLLHGLARGLDAGIVMGLVSVAGVLAHQLVTAGALRSRTERAAARVERRAAAKVAKIRRAAIRQAVAEVDADGAARLVIAPGRYVLTKGRLVAAIDTTTPPEATGDLGTGVAEEAAAWLAGQPTAAAIDGPGDGAGRGAGDGLGDRGPVATLDPDADPDRPGSGPTGASSGGRMDRPAGRGADRASAQRKSSRTRRTRKSTRTQPSRSITDLRRELSELLAADPHAVDPSSAESIRKALRCAPKTARQLRDEH